MTLLRQGCCLSRQPPIAIVRRPCSWPLLCLPSATTRAAPPCAVACQAQQVFKYYDFVLPGSDSASQLIAFSSYPGCISSTDNFYMMETLLSCRLWYCLVASACSACSVNPVAHEGQTIQGRLPQLCCIARRLHADLGELPQACEVGAAIWLSASERLRWACVERGMQRCKGRLLLGARRGS